MPHVKSLYPEPSPVPDHLNAYETVFRRSEQDNWPDFNIHLEEPSGKTRTFVELRKRINDLATALGTPTEHGGLGLQVGDGEMIGIMSDNSSDYIVLILALLKIAAPFALISCYSTPFELKHILTLTKPTRLFVAPQYVPIIQPVAKGIKVAKENIYVMGPRLKGYKSLEGLIKGVNTMRIPEIKVRIVPKNTLAYLVFSSGTSGLPKAVMTSHGNVDFAIKQAAVLQEQRAAVAPPVKLPTPDGRLVNLAFLPMHHVYGLYHYCFRGFAAPVRFIILPRWDIERVLKIIPKHKVSNLGLVPSLVHQLVSHPKIGQTDLSSLHSVHSGAAYLPREVSTRLLAYLRQDVFFGEGYGMSETAVSAIVQPFPGSLGGLLKSVPGSSGILLPGMEARLVRDDGSDAGYNEVGELWLRGQNIVIGYWNNPNATQAAFVDGWLRTGDEFSVDKDGYFFYADRAKDILKVSGSQVSPMEIENALLAHPRTLISDATVAGVSGGRTDDEKVPRAWVVLSKNGRELGASAVIKELDGWHRENLSKYKWLRGGIEVVKEIPKSPTGKTLRRVLQDKYEQRVGVRARL